MDKKKFEKIVRTNVPFIIQDKLKGKNQNNISKQLGINAGYLSKLKKGERDNITLSLAICMASIFKINLEDFFYEELIRDESINYSTYNTLNETMSPSQVKDSLILKISSNMYIKRNKSNYSIKEVAKKTGLSESSILRIEKGEKNVSLIVIATLIDFYGITVMELYK